MLRYFFTTTSASIVKDSSCCDCTILINYYNDYYVYLNIHLYVTHTSKKHKVITNLIKCSYCFLEVKLCIVELFVIMYNSCMWFGSTVKSRKQNKLTYNDGPRRLLCLPGSIAFHITKPLP